MPGRNPHEAVDNYLRPLQRALSCLKGSVKIVRTGKIRSVGDEGAWTLNGESGMELPGFGEFFAEQRFRLIPSDPERFDPAEGKFRVTTRMYAYRVQFAAGWLMWHWHPGGNSPEDRPHQHFSFRPSAHIPTSRVTLEEVLEACIALGAEPGCDDWPARLQETEGVHKLHRTWVNYPGESGSV